MFNSQLSIYMYYLIFFSRYILHSVFTIRWSMKLNTTVVYFFCRRDCIDIYILCSDALQTTSLCFYFAELTLRRNINAQICIILSFKLTSKSIGCNTKHKVKHF